MANRSAENTSQGYVLCCGCRYFHEWLRSKVKTVSDRLRFWELGCEHLYILTVLHAVFGFWSNFCCCCFVVVVVLLLLLFFLRFCGWFFLRFLIDPLTDSCFANWKSLFLKLQIFLFVLFRVLNKSRPCLVISSEIVRGILLIVNFFYFLEIKCSCLFHFTLEFMTEM